jgi:hypothetical protein
MCGLFVMPNPSVAFPFCEFLPFSPPLFPSYNFDASNVHPKHEHVCNVLE